MQNLYNVVEVWAESASGKFPIQAVRMMDRIIRQAEGSRFFAPAASEPDHTTPDSIAHAACAIAREVGAKLIVTLTESGLTARLVSKARPSAPIMAFSTDDRTGSIRGYVGEGEFTDDLLDTFGGAGGVRIPKLQELLRYICERGFEHHVAANLAQVAPAVHEAATRYLGWSVVQHASA